MDRTDRFRAMTFNLRHHRAGRRGWPARREAAARVVAHHAPDVLGTQEGLLPQLLDLHEALPHHDVVGEARRGGQDDEFVAIFYDRRRFDAEEHGNFWLSATPDVPGSMGWGNYVPRMTTWARLRDRETGGRFLAMNTHLDHFHPRARRRGASLIGERVPKTLGEPVLLSGDFNSLPRWFYAHRHLTGEGGFQDTFDLARERCSRFGRTFHGFTGRGLMRLDWILCRPQWEVFRHATVRDAPGGVHPSDHFPVLVEVALPQVRVEEPSVSLVPQGPPAPELAPLARA